MYKQSPTEHNTITQYIKGERLLTYGTSNVNVTYKIYLNDWNSLKAPCKLYHNTCITFTVKANLLAISTLKKLNVKSQRVSILYKSIHINVLLVIKRQCHLKIINEHHKVKSMSHSNLVRTLLWAIG